MFETFDLKAFGSHIRNVRKSLGLTQKDIQDSSGITLDALRKIENGRVLPRFETIVYLSYTLKKDLLKDLENYRNSNPLFMFYEKLDELVIDMKHSTFVNLTKEFDKYLSTKQDTKYINTEINRQFKMMIQGIEHYYQKDHQACYDCILEAIQISSPFFKIDTFESLKYNFFELRLMILLANTLSYLESYDVSNKMFLYVLDHLGCHTITQHNEKLLKIKVLVNLSYNAHIEDDHKKALDFAIKGIECCNHYQISYCLGLLLYRKGVAGYHLKTKDYRKDFEAALITLKATDNHKFYQYISNMLTEKYEYK